MSDQFDKKLVNRINEVFDNFEDDSANEGWAELRKQFPGKSERRPAIWWFSSAAAILLVCGFWFFSNQQITDVEEITKNKKVAKNNAEVANQQTPEVDDIAKTNQVVAKNNTEVKDPILNEEEIQTTLKKNYNQSPSNILLKPNNKFRTKPQEKLARIESEAVEETKQADKLKESSEHNLTLMALIPNQSIKPDSAVIATIPVETSPRAITDNANNNRVNNEPSEVLESTTLTSETHREAGKEKSAKSNKIITLGLFAGSYFNYAEGSKTSMNNGVGLSSEIKISKKLKISTGISLAQNSLQYDQLIPQEAAKDFSSSRNKPQFDLYYNSPALTASSVSYSINSYDAKLLGLDIPVNLKYTLIEKKNTVYLITGFSSNFFINESYTYAFDYKMSGNSITDVPNQESSSNFQSFDFARVLNLSVGVDYPLNNKSRLSFEPFIKYPLSGLGAHDLKFGAAGINLKLNFNRLK